MAGPNGRRSLAARLKEKRIIVAPGVYDAVTARIADRMGFEALYMTGYGTVASHLGLPDAGLATYSEMAARVAVIVENTTTPLIADADTGYGGLLNVRRTVQGYEAAGAAGIQIEDQEMPKKCGHTPGRRVVPIEEMVQKIQVAVDARRHDDTLIVARTDARTTLGIDEALRRGEAFAKAGADVLFIESPETEEELARIGRSFDVPTLCNVVNTGRTPELPSEQLQALGFRIAIYPGMALKAASQAVTAAYGYLHGRGTTLGINVPLMDSKELHDLMGFPDVWAFEKRWHTGTGAAE
ncbi:MAG: isocitrate lyase/PEP mutase family protein [Alphaproteobacteria bacterium]|nr:isocitrate lyase/PEP mutase family protein [Alphaproteobacteria bacterium]